MSFGSLQAVAVCEHCDAVHRWRGLASNEVARCSRCASVLGRGHRLNAPAMLALTLGALVMFLIANFADLATIDLQGRHATATLPLSIRATWNEGSPIVAVTTALTAIVTPALLILVRLYLLIPLCRGIRARYFGPCMRLLHETARWSMVEVLMVSGVISIVRMGAIADSSFGIGMWAFGALSILIAALESAGMRHLWLPG